MEDKYRRLLSIPGIGFYDAVHALRAEQLSYVTIIKLIERTSDPRKLEKLEYLLSKFETKDFNLRALLNLVHCGDPYVFRVVLEILDRFEKKDLNCKVLEDTLDSPFVSDAKLARRLLRRHFSDKAEKDFHSSEVTEVLALFE